MRRTPCEVGEHKIAPTSLLACVSDGPSESGRLPAVDHNRVTNREARDV